MSNATYFAHRNATSAFKAAYNTRYNPLLPVRTGLEKLAKSARDDKPTKDIYRKSIPMHLLRVGLAGPRRGAACGAHLAKGLHKLVSGSKDDLVGEDTRVERAPMLNPTWLQSAAGVGGSLVGGLLGFGIKTIEHLAVTGVYLGAMLGGLMAGTAIGLPIAAVYSLYVGASGGKRAELRQTRRIKNAKALDALNAAAEPAPAVAQTLPLPAHIRKGKLAPGESGLLAKELARQQAPQTRADWERHIADTAA